MENPTPLDYQIAGIEQILAKTYKKLAKISGSGERVNGLLLSCGLYLTQIRELEEKHWPEIINLILEVWMGFINKREDADVYWGLLCDRYGLLGTPPLRDWETCKDLDIPWGELPEKEKTALRKLALPQRKTVLNQILRRESYNLLYGHPPKGEDREPQTPSKRIPAQIVELRKSYPRAYEPWTSAEDQKLSLHFHEGETVEKLSVLLDRTSSAIRLRIVKLGLDRNR